ncbi:MAG: trigger factor [Buchnera aphidicola (Kaburagia rhusicola rhusicola)]
MELEIKKNKNLLRNVHITIPNNIIKKSIYVEFLKLNNTIHTNGFRKGKTPLHTLKKNYGETVQKQVLKELIKQYFLDKIKKETFQIAGTPNFILQKYKNNQDLNCLIEFEIYPKFKLKIDQFTIQTPVINITEQDIQKIAEKSFKNNIWIEVDRTITLYDKITITCINHSSNKEFKKYNLYNFQFIIGNNEILPEIEEQLLVHKTNESFFINIKFSKHHCEKQIANKICEIEIIIKKVEELKEKILEKKEKNKLNLSQKQHNNIKNILKNQSQVIIEHYIKSKIIHNLIESNPIDIPSTLIKSTFVELREKQINIYKKNVNNIFSTINTKDLTIEARNQVTTTILLNKLIQDYLLEPNINNIQNLIQKYATSHHHAKKLILLYKNNANIKQYFNNVDLEQQAITKILEKSIKYVKKYDFHEAMQNLIM